MSNKTLKSLACYLVVWVFFGWTGVGICLLADVLLITFLKIGVR
jgi:hypothetical protein